MKIPSSAQLREADQFNIKTEPITSLDLMERAAMTCLPILEQLLAELPREVCIFCGTGNNGGDGLVIARHLLNTGFCVEVIIVPFSASRTPDFEQNLMRLRELPAARISELKENTSSFDLNGKLIIDALLGIGSDRAACGILAHAIQLINDAVSEVVAIDVPSGMICELPQPENSIIVQATHTLTFQHPKLNFFLPETGPYVGELTVLDIGLSKSFISALPSDYLLITDDYLKNHIKPREKFSHKGSHGHAIIVAGSTGKFGAAVLCAKAAIRGGSGLCTVVVPENGNQILQIAVPEAMTIPLIECKTKISGKTPALPEGVLGIGPGIGSHEETIAFLNDLLVNRKSPIVLDADGLNCAAKDATLLQHIPKGSILTPHVKEFDRLFGASDTTWERIEKQREYVRKTGNVLVLKGAHSLVALPSGEVYVNTSGNPGLAKGGSGDVLTGLLTALLAQGYTSEEAAISGVYIHGKTAEKVSQSTGVYAMTAGDLAEAIRLDL
jgi:ADP-dependent NAD(P)H-hydrate dehydratase / NAD(P)H-hydrate epimerase